MKQFLIIIFILIALLGCNSKTIKDSSVSVERFSIEYSQTMEKFSITILKDDSTGVKYLWVTENGYSNRSGLCKLSNE